MQRSKHARFSRLAPQQVLLYYSSRRQMRPPFKAVVNFLRDAYRHAKVG